MSKLAEKIRNVSRPQMSSLGFGSNKQAAAATLVLAGMARDAGGAADVVKAGADLVIVGSAQSPAKAGGGNDGLSVAGAWIAGTSENEAKSFKDAGFDFVIFDPDRATATALLEDNVGYVMSLARDLSDSELRTLEGFQLDAIHVGTIEGALTVRTQMALRRLVSMTRKPLMASVRGDIALAELQALRETSVVVVVADGAKDVERLRRTIDALPPRSRRKDGEDRPTPLVPHSMTVGDGDEHEHDDE